MALTPLVNGSAVDVLIAWLTRPLDAGGPVAYIPKCVRQFMGIADGERWYSRRG